MMAMGGNREWHATTAKHDGGAFWHCFGQQIERCKNKNKKNVVALNGHKTTKTVDLDKSKSENRLKMGLNFHDRKFKTVEVF